MTASTDFRPRRSVLYVPASNARALEKAARLACDVVILDLEDAVSPGDKAEARQAAHEALTSGAFAGKETVLRINGLDTRWAAHDLTIAGAADAVLLPKVETALDIRRAEAGLDQIAPGPKPALWAMIETPRAVLDIAAIAAEAERQGSRLACFVIGTNDLAKDTRVQVTASRLPLLPWMSQCVLAARAYGLAVLDGVYNDFRDLDGFSAECRQARALGFDGKTLIHPSQIGPTNTAFGPSEQEIAEARVIVEAFGEPENARKSVISVDGRMIERLHLAMAERVLELAGLPG